MLIDVAACALNHLDVDIREGISRFPVEPPFILGVEVVGRIAELGEGVEGWQVGERVMPYLMDTCGAAATAAPAASRSAVGRASSASRPRAATPRARLLAAHLIRVPDELSDEAAAALQIAFGTAWHMLFTRGRLAGRRDRNDQLGRKRHRLGRRAARASSPART